MRNAIGEDSMMPKGPATSSRSGLNGAGEKEQHGCSIPVTAWPADNSFNLSKLNSFHLSDNITRLHQLQCDLCHSSATTTGLNREKEKCCSAVWMHGM